MLIRTNIYLDTKTLKDLKIIAAQDNKSVAEVVRNMIKDALKKGPPVKPKDPLTKLVNLAKKHKWKDIEGKTDVALNHDYYLYVEPYEKKNNR